MRYRLDDQRFVHRGDVQEEVGEVVERDLDVVCAAHLSDAVHGKLRHTHVDAPHSDARGHDGPDGRATPAVVSDAEALRREAGDACNLFEQKARHGCCGIPLVGVVLDHETLVELRLVLGLVFLLPGTKGS
jgi:hypothetical protein